MMAANHMEFMERLGSPTNIGVGLTLMARGIEGSSTGMANLVGLFVEIGQQLDESNHRDPQSIRDAAVCAMSERTETAVSGLRLCAAGLLNVEPGGVDDRVDEIISVVAYGCDGGDLPTGQGGLIGPN